MKKFLLFSFLVFSVTFFYAQSSSLDFSMQLQNNNPPDVTIYPNPVQYPVFKISSSAVISRVEIVDLVGKTVFSRKFSNNSLDDIIIKLDNCHKGVYLVKIIFVDDSQVIKKLIFN